MPAKAPVSVRQAAMNLLARREHSRLELERKLASRDYSENETKPALDALESEGLLSNKRFAAAYVAERRRRGFGPHKIRDELMERGLDEAMANDAMSGIDWAAEARRCVARKYAGPPADKPGRAERQNYLLRRGFDHDDAVCAVRDE